MWYLMLAQRHLDLHAGRHVVPEQLNHVSHGLSPARGRVNNLYDYDLAWVRVSLLTVRHQYCLTNAFVLGHNNANSIIEKVAPNHSLVSSLQDLNDRPLFASTRIDAANSRHDSITMHDLAHLSRRQI